MKEYSGELGEAIDFSQLEAPLLSRKEYAKAHKSFVILCHDAIIKYQGGFLLVEREVAPAQGKLWLVGGRVQRGLSMVDSLRQKVNEECGLDLEEIREIGVARTSFATDPFGHGKGTDTFNVIFYGKGRGELKLDVRHKNPCIVTQKNYASLRKRLHPYVRDFLDLVIGKSKFK